MTSQIETDSRDEVLVFLPANVANAIVSKLVEHGYFATAVQSVSELFEALQSEHYRLAVTTRPDIDVVRRIRPIPVINIEVFFHKPASADSSVAAEKRFDSDAFIARVKALNVRRPGFSSAFTSSVADQPKSLFQAPVRWYRAVKAVLIKQTSAVADQ